MIDRLRNLDGLAIAALVFLGANLLHGIDHLRTGLERLAVPVPVGGAAITAGAVLSLVLALRDHPRAPLVATAVGLWSALLIANAHLAPDWGSLSDSYVGNSFDAFSWTVVIAELAAALTLGVVGARELRHRAVQA